MTESAHNTTVTPSPYITDASGGLWCLVESPTRGTQIAYNGVTDTSTGLVTLLLYYNHKVYQQNSAGGWWSWNGTWQTDSDPRISVAAITGITLSNSKITAGSPSGTVVGAITVAMSSGSFSGTLTLSGTNASLFAISGTNLVTNGVVSAGTYSVNVVAAQAGVGGSPFTQPFGITATSGAVGVTAPPQAAKAGYNTLVFSDDFTSTNTVTTSYTPSSGFNWYPSNNGSFVLTSPTNYEVQTTAMASSIGSGAGMAPSPNGGLMVVKGAGNPGSGLQLNNQFQTVSNKTQFTSNPGGHYWKHAYFEAYMYYNPTAYAQWSFCLAWWSFPTVSSDGANGIEVDFFEQGNANSSGPAGFGVVDPPAKTQVAAANYPKNDGKWHLFGALWEYNSAAGTGRWSAWYDNVQVPFIRGGTSTYYCTTGPGTTAPNGERGIGNCMVLGNTLGNTPLYIDYIRVWQ